MTPYLWLLIVSLSLDSTQGWVSSIITSHNVISRLASFHRNASEGDSSAIGNAHGQNHCFLPIQQLHQDTHTPRIVPIAGVYPGLSSEEFLAPIPEPISQPGQWSYHFYQPHNGNIKGSIAIPGSALISSCVDIIAIIAGHSSLGIPLPKDIEGEVDVVVLVDRSVQTFTEKNFLVWKHDDSGPEEKIQIGAFGTGGEIPVNCKIMGQVSLVMIPWLPGMKRNSMGFMEDDEYQY